MLPRDLVFRQHRIVEEIAALIHAEKSNAGIDQNTERGKKSQDRFRDNPFGSSEPEHQSIEDEGGTENDTGLKPATRAVVAMKLHIERKHDDQRNHGFGDNPENNVFRYTGLCRCDVGRALLRAPQQKKHGDACSEDHDHFTQRVEAAITRQHRGYNIRHAGFGYRLFDVVGGDMGLRRRLRVAECGDVQGAVNQRGPGGENHQ